jgi:Do/DeqQ family serine protease
MVEAMRGRAPAAALAFVVAFVLGLAPLRAEVPVRDPERGVMTMAPLLERTTPAVVNIAVETRRPGATNPLLRDPFFRRFFDLPERRPERRGRSAGSGVIVDAEAGWILTNHHVVENADRVVVTLRDGRELAAELRGSDPETDIALLRVEASGLVDIPFADSDALAVGDLVVAIGNPFGLGQTVTSGIISALGRGGIGAGRYEDFIQTDAPINPGNSGGALVNSKGELVGINTAILAPSGGNVGIGFAVPANMARAVMDQLVRYGEVRRGRIGVVIQDLNAELARALGVDGDAGAVIAGVEPGSPAERAGLEPGMVVVAVDGRPVDGARALSNAIGLTERGEEVVLTVVDGDGRRELELVVGDPGPSASAVAEALPALAGAALADADGRVQGVAVRRVAPGSPARRFGLRAEDVILAVNRERVRGLGDLERFARGGGRIVVLDVLRGDRRILLARP